MRPRIAAALLASALTLGASGCAAQPSYVFASFRMQDGVGYFDLGHNISGKLAAQGGCLVIDTFDRGRALLVLSRPMYWMDGDVLHYTSRQANVPSAEWRLGDVIDVREIRPQEHFDITVPAPQCPGDLPRLTTSIHSAQHRPR